MSIATLVKKAAVRVNKSTRQEPVKQCENAVEARYFTGELLPEYAENPLISALGPMGDKKAIMRALHNPVAFSESERSRSVEYRLNAIGRLSRLVVPMPAHLDVVHMVQLIVRQHYVGHSIQDNLAEAIHDRYKSAQDGTLSPIYPHARSHAYCAGIFGLSGAGKSTSIECALRFMPQVIHHPQYGVNQVVWVKIDCPRSASLKDTLKLLILTFDELLGTDYMREVGTRATLADYANKLHRITRRHRTGLIVLDEIQNALHAVERSDPLFDFFVNLTNVVGVPVIVSGTPKAQRLFRKTLRSARRLSSQGVITWKGIEDEADWNRLWNQLEKYQWLSKAEAVPVGLRRYLASLTQGLPGVLVPLYQLTQYAAIYSEEERLSEKLFRDTFEEKMESLKPMLAAIRSGNKARMAQYEDLLGDMLEDVVASNEATVKRDQYYQAAIVHDLEESVLDAVSRLLLLGVPEGAASSLVAKVQTEFPAASAQELSDEAARRFYQKRAPRESMRGRVNKTEDKVIA